MITCRELADFLMDYLSGELAAGQRAAFEEHLSVCPSCVTYLDTYEKTVALGRASYAEPDDPASEHVPEELVRAIVAARARGD